MSSKNNSISSVLLNYASTADHTGLKEAFNTESTRNIRALLVKWAEHKRDISINKTDEHTRLDSSAYAEHQAWQSGYRKALKEVHNLLKLTDRSEN